MRKHREILNIGTGLKAGVAVIAILAAWPATAQDATQLQTIVVEGNGSESGASVAPVKGYVAKASNAGSKSDTPINEIPQSVSVVGKQEMNDRGVTNKVDEALRYTAGVYSEPFGSDPDTDWLYIRGFDASQTGVFYDGLPLFAYGFGNFQVDPFMLERVDVLKGPSSVLYGGSNPGGLVNYVRKRPTDNPYYYTETGINTEGNAFLGFDVSDAVGSSETMKYRITGKIAGGDNYSDFSHDFRGFIMPQLEISPDDSTSFTLWGSFYSFDQVHSGNSFFPYTGSVVNAPFGKLARDSYYGEPDNDDGVTDQEMIGYDFSHEFDNGWKVSQNVRYGHVYKHEKYLYLYGYADATGGGGLSSPLTSANQLGRLLFETTAKVDTFNVDNRLEGEFNTGAARHNVMFGLDYKYYEIYNFQSSIAGTPISATNPVYGVTQPSSGRSYANQTVTQQQVGIYAQDQIHFGDGWLLTANGRYDFVHTDTHSGPTFWSPTTSTDYDFDKGALSGRIGLAYEFDNGLTPYVSAGTFFAPIIALTETPNNKPEEGEQFEAGVKYEPTFMDGLLTASVFHINKKNMVTTSVPDSEGRSFSQQLGEVEARGFEMEGKVNLDDNWKILASLSYTDLEITKDLNPVNIGQTPILVPETQASMWLDYSVNSGALEGLSVGGGVRYLGKSWVNQTNTLRVPDATVFDAAIRYKKNDWEGSLNVSNLFDKDYVRGCNGEFGCGYGDARTITFKLSKTW